MRLALLLALAALCASDPALAQSALPRRQPTTEGSLRGTAQTRTDTEVNAARLRSEARLKVREDKARRTLKGICSGC